MSAGTGGAFQRSRRVFWRAYLSGGFGLAMDAQVAFLVPLRARELGATFDVIGLIMGAGALAPALLAVSSGAIIDRMGPKRAFIAATALTALCWLPMMVATDYRWFLVLQPLLGIARNLGWVASQVYITSLGAAEDRPALAGRFALISSVGQMIAPILVGTGAQVAGVRWAMLVPITYAAAFGLLGLTLQGAAGAGPATERVRQGMGFRSAAGLLVIRGIQAAMLLTFARLWIATLYGAFLPVFLIDTGLAPGIVGAVMATSGFVAALIAPTTGYWTRRLPQHIVVTVGLSCGAAGLVSAPHLAFVPAIFLVPVLVGIGSGLSLPILMSLFATSAPPGQQGVALGLRSLVNKTSATVAPVMVGALIAALGMAPAFTAGGIVAGIALAGSRLISTAGRRRRDAPGPGHRDDASRERPSP